MRLGGPRRLGNRWNFARVLFAVSLAGAGALLVGQQFTLDLKAQLAEKLIDRAFARHLESGAPELPWSWADTWPVARLKAPHLGVQRTVLAGSSGTSMAFGPSHLDGSSPPNGAGNCVFNGHRDGAFLFLGQLERGDALQLQTHGATLDYEVIDLVVINEHENWILQPSGQALLTLVTCYPFGGLTPTDERYVVIARPVDTSGTTDIESPHLPDRRRPVRSCPLPPRARRARPWSRLPGTEARTI